MKESGAQTLAESLTQMPGITALTTGAISRPVIRALQGNRILINVAGLSLEDQEWEDEHGLGLSDVGVERVELIKGPAAVLFGPDAMGGVINIIEDAPPAESETHQRINAKLFSNTLGTGFDYSFATTKNNSLLINAGAENHGDYYDGEDHRVPNTRFALYNLKLAYIIKHSSFESENRLICSYDLFGFIADTAELHTADEESRLSRTLDNAHHSVLLSLFSSKNTVKLNKATTFKIVTGLQSNWRQEQERSNKVDMSLLLNTFSQNIAIDHDLTNNLKLIGGLAGMYQINTNIGKRKVVPDASTTELSVYSYAIKHWKQNKLSGNFETGLRYDRVDINTDALGEELPVGNSSGFSRGFDELSGSIGHSLIAGELVFKADLGTGFRAGNLAELASNGLHEGSLNWYIGNPDLKIEHCINLDISAEWHPGIFTFYTSVFRNKFFNYIYLQPTNEEFAGYSIFRFEQSDAIIQGFELGAGAIKRKYFELTSSYSYLQAKRDNGSWLPFTPANQLRADTKLFLLKNKLDQKEFFISLGTNYVAEQKKIAGAELPSESYILFHAGAGITFSSLRVLLSCRNLTNAQYSDHLSRLRYYGVSNMGRNIVLHIGWQF